MNPIFAFSLTLDNALTALVYIVLAFILFLIGKLTYQLIHRNYKVNHELVEKDNLAFAVAHVGYYSGLLLAIGSAIIGPSEGLWLDLMDIAIYGILAIVLLNLSIIINDKLILRHFKVSKEIIQDQNVGTGVIEGASAIATGLIIMGAVSGEDGGIDTAIVFWLIGQGMLIVTSFVYDAILPYDLHEHIEKDNVAVGIGFAGALIAVANLIRFGIAGDFTTWEETSFYLLIDVAIALALLPILRWITDKMLLPGRKLTDEIVNQEKPNSGVALIEAFAYIGSSVLISWCL